MSRIDQLFRKKKERILNVYCTAGYPHADSTVPVIKALQDSGVDLV
jgi:tryptophan synthase alpha chain